MAAERGARVALFGLGGVGRAFLELLHERDTGLELVLAADSRGALIGDGLDPAAVLERKAAGLPPASASVAALLDRAGADIVVDLTACDFRTAEPAASVLLAALSRGASVVTANKAPLARRWREIRGAAAERGLQIGYASAAGAALPAVEVARALGRADRIESIEGVLNGTASFVLRETATGRSFGDAVRTAQEQGIAEPDPSMDLGGWDTASKLVILANTLWDVALDLDDVAVTGIDETNASDADGAPVQLIGRAQVAGGDIVADVRPRTLAHGHPLAALAAGEKGVLFEGPSIGRVLVSGGRSSPRGAAAAALGDVLRIGESG